MSKPKCGGVANERDVPWGRDLSAVSPATTYCGHGFPIPKCPFEQCAARELYEALKLFIGFLNDGTLIRDISNDDRTDWALSQIPLVKAATLTSKVLASLETH